MLILFDHSTPAPLRYALQGHTVVEAIERGWERLVNGTLLDTAESAGFEVLITADKNLRYQQNLSERKTLFWFSETRNGPSCATMLKECLQPSTPRHRAALPK